MHYQKGNIWEAESPSPPVTGPEATSPCQTLIWVHPCAHQASALSVLQALGHSLPPVSPYSSWNSSLKSLLQFILELGYFSASVSPPPLLGLALEMPHVKSFTWWLNEPGTGCAWKSSLFRNFNLGVQISIMHSNHCLQQTQSLENWALGISNLCLVLCSNFTDCSFLQHYTLELQIPFK